MLLDTVIEVFEMLCMQAEPMFSLSRIVCGHLRHGILSVSLLKIAMFFTHS